MDSPPATSWSIHSRPEIIAKYKILERVGSGAYSDVYRAIRLSDNLTVALKAVHDYQSAFREIEALQALHSCPNVIVLYEYFWRENEDAVLVLEFLTTDLATVIKSAKKREGGIGCGKVKRWMLQILSGVDSCHRNMVVHRDLKPCNLLIGDDGVLKLADFGQPAPAPAPAPDCFTNLLGLSDCLTYAEELARLDAVVHACSRSQGQLDYHLSQWKATGLH